jgi:hypothetical protein
MPPKKYCGTKAVPEGSVRGTPYQCLQTGIYIGEHKPPSKKELAVKEAFNTLKAAREERIRAKEKKLAIVETALESRHKAKKLLEEGIIKTGKLTAVKGAIEKKKLIDDIKTKGLPVLKRQLKLSLLNSRELTGLAAREHSKDRFVPHYSKVSPAELVPLLVQRGYKL